MLLEGCLTPGGGGRQPTAQVRPRGGTDREGLYRDYAPILAERPVLKPFMGQITQSLVASLHLDLESVNLKATTTDGLGFIGRGEWIGSLAIATVEPLE